MDLKRRTFLKALGLTAAGSLLPGCERDVNRLVPYVLPDDEIVPGVANWYSSVCRECEAGCGIVVRVMEGRAKKIEGNPDHPLNRGKLCAKGQAALQRLYNPDRLRGPLRRDEARDAGSFLSVPWDTGLALLTEQLQQAGARIWMISRPLAGTLSTLVSSFTQSQGGRLFYYDPGAELPLRTAIRQLHGVQAVPQYDLAQSDYVLSFGAPFLEQWDSPVSYGIAYGQMRQGRPAIRGRFIQVEPRLSITGSNADRWLPIRPGAEGVLAMGIGQVLLEKRPGSITLAQRRTYESAYGALTLDQIADRTDMTPEQIVTLGEEFASASSPVALGGGTACAHTNGTDTLMLINGLNALAGGVNRPGGLRLYQPADFSAARNIPWLTEQAVMTFTQNGGRELPRVLLLYGCNPLFGMPPTIPIRTLFDRIDFIASFSSFMDESTAMADLILPDHDTLESWGDHVQPSSCPAPAVGLAQPVVRPLYDTRPIGDTLLDLSRRLQPGELQGDSFQTVLEDRWRTFLQAQPDHTPTRDETSAWEGHVQQGGWWSSTSRPMPLVTRTFPTNRTEPSFAGTPDVYPFFLYPYPSPALGFGEGANLPWLQELPDLMTTAMWGTWAEINPSTAASLAVLQGNLIRIVSPYGSIEVPVVLYPGIRPDVVAVPIGQGHETYGRYATGRGANPLSLLAPLVDTQSGAAAHGATRIRVETTGRQGTLVLSERSAVRTDLITIRKGRHEQG